MIICCTGQTHVATATCIQRFFAANGITLQNIGLSHTHSLLFGGIARSSCVHKFFLDDNNFVLLSGTFVWKGATGSRALHQFLLDFDPHRPDPRSAFGHFTLFLKKNTHIILAADSLGVNKIYHADDDSIFSDRFIGVAAGLKIASPDAQGCYEYAWNGAVFGTETFVRQIKVMPPATLAVLSYSIQRSTMPKACIDIEGEKLSNVRDLVSFHIDKLRNIVGHLVNNCKSGVNLSLSGGYDSRLLLAILLDIGVLPQVFVYGRPNDKEVAIVKELCLGEKLEFTCIDKSCVPPLDVIDYSRHLVRNYFLFDGWKNDGLFDNGADASDRFERTAGGITKMNGSGGEIYRNFFYLRNRAFSLKELVWSFYCQYDPAVFTQHYGVREYEKSVAKKIAMAIGAKADTLNRDQVELVYPFFRLRYWTGRDVPINQNFGLCLFPFLEPSVIAGTHRIPISLKNYGLFEGRMLRTINPRLARYPSIYGHSFAEDAPSAYRFNALFSYIRPPYIRRFSYVIKSRLVKSTWPYYLAPEFLACILKDASFPFMRQFFILERILDPSAYNRILTMEYLFQHYLPCESS